MKAESSLSTTIMVYDKKRPFAERKDHRMATYLSGWDDKGRRSYDISGEYADDKVDRLLAALRKNMLTVRVELHHHRLGPDQRVELFIPVPEGKMEKVDAAVRKLVGEYLKPGTA